MAEKGIEEEFLTCPICFQVFKEPKTLSCLHRFCGKCLHNYIVCQKKSSLLKLSGFYCPVCREVIKSPEPHRDPSEWADALKTDFYLANLIRFVDKKGGANVDPPVPKPQHACDVHKDKELDLYCLDCQTAICHLCAGIKHRGCVDVTTLQEIVSKKKDGIQKSLKSVQKSIEEISRVQQKGLDRFEKMKSNVQVDIKTRAYEWYTAIQKEEQRLLASLESQCEKVYNKITPKLMEIESKLLTFKEKANIFENNSEKMSDFEVHKLISDDMDVSTYDLNSYKSVVEKLGRIEIQFKKLLKPDVNLGQVVTSGIGEKTSDIPAQPKTLAITSQSGTQVYTLDDNESVVFPNKNSTRDKSGGETPTPANSTMKNLRAKLSRIIPSSFSSENPGVPDTTQKSPPVPPKKPVPVPRERAPSNIPTPLESNENDATNATIARKSAVEKLRTIATRFRDYTYDPKLRDLIVTGSTVIVTDWANQTVKAFCVRRDQDSRLEVGGKPWSITKLSDTLAAVSLPLNKQIAIIKTTPPLMMQNSFVAAKNYSGLATLNNSMLVASGGSDPPSVDIINLYGEVLRSFATSQDGSPLFMYPAYVCVTAAMFILVSDKVQGAIFCMTHKGEVKFKFQLPAPKNLQDPCGLCTTPSGHVMLLENRGLLQLSPGGQFDRPLIRKVDGHISDPKGIALDSEGLVYITTNEQEVTVFKL